MEDLEVSQQLIPQELEAQMPRIIGELEMFAKGRDEVVSQEILKTLENIERSPGEKFLEQASGLLPPPSARCSRMLFK